MRRASAAHNPGVSLFPFLAVLICTMGVMMLLLVIINRPGAAAIDDSEPPPDAVFEEGGKGSAASVANGNGGASAAGDALGRDREMLKWRISQLEISREKTVGDLRDERMRLSTVEDGMRKLRGQWRQVGKAADDLEHASNAKDNDKQSVAAFVDRLQADLTATHERLGKAIQEARNQAPAYAIVPYDGPNGTRRRPIYIECRDDAIVLQPEGIELMAHDFDGPKGPGNPLASTLRAARDYMAGGSAPAPGAEPYPLLIVRSDGIEAFYMARSAMSSWASEFGYELIEADRKLVFPQPNPQLAQVERTALADARARYAWFATTRTGHEEQQTHDRPVYRAAKTGGIVREGEASLADADSPSAAGFGTSGFGGSGTGRFGGPGTGSGYGSPTAGNSGLGSGNGAGNGSGYGTGATAGTSMPGGPGGGPAFVPGSGYLALPGSSTPSGSGVGTGGPGYGTSGSGSGGLRYGGSGDGTGGSSYGTGGGLVGGAGTGSGNGSGAGSGGGQAFALGNGYMGLPGSGGSGGSPYGNAGIPGGVPGGQGGGYMGLPGSGGSGGPVGAGYSTGGPGGAPNGVAGGPAGAGVGNSAAASSGAGNLAPGNFGTANSGTGNYAAENSVSGIGGPGFGTSSGGLGSTGYATSYATGGATNGVPSVAGGPPGGNALASSAPSGAQNAGYNAIPGSPATNPPSGPSGGNSGNFGSGVPGGSASAGQNASAGQSGSPGSASSTAGDPAALPPPSNSLGNLTLGSAGGGTSSSSDGGDGDAAPSGMSLMMQNKSPSQKSSSDINNTPTTPYPLQTGPTGPRPGEYVPSQPESYPDKPKPQDDAPSRSHDSLAEKRGHNWSLPSTAKLSTPVSRTIHIECRGDRLTLKPDFGNPQPRIIPFGPRTADSVDKLVAAVWDYTKGWGIAGRQMYWKPQLELELGESGEGRYSELQALLADSGLEVARKTSVSTSGSQFR